MKLVRLLAKSWKGWILAGRIKDGMVTASGFLSPWLFVIEYHSRQEKVVALLWRCPNFKAILSDILSFYTYRTKMSTRKRHRPMRTIVCLAFW